MNLSPIFQMFLLIISDTFEVIDYIGLILEKLSYSEVHPQSQNVHHPYSSSNNTQNDLTFNESMVAENLGLPHLFQLDFNC